jgi:hypothetical protein
MTRPTLLVERLESAARRWWIPASLSALLIDAAATIEVQAETETILRAKIDRLQDQAESRLAAGNRLSMMAQTTGGTAGPDPGLQNAIAGWEAATGGPKRPTRPVGVDGGNAI